MAAGTGGREAHGHHVGGIGDEGAAHVGDAILLKLHLCHSRVHGERAAVVLHAFCQARFYREFAQGGVRTEAELRFAVGLIGHGAVEVLCRKACCLVPVAISESLAYFGQEMRRLFVGVPIVCRAFGSARAAAPEGLFIERVPFDAHRPHHVAADAAIAQRQRALLPFAVEIDGALAGADGFLAIGEAFGMSLPPCLAAFEGAGRVEVN